MQLNREFIINKTILSYIDVVYLSMYSKRFVFAKRSVSHLNRAIDQTLQIISRDLSEIDKCNEIELSMLAKFEELTRQIRYTDVISSRIIPNTDEIELLLNRHKSYQEGPHLAYIKTILAMCGQLQYTNPYFAIPRLTINEGSKHAPPIMRNIIRQSIGISANFADTVQSVDGSSASLTSGVASLRCGHLWYNLFRFVIIPVGNRIHAVNNLCSYMQIPVLPDTKSGMGITTITYDKFIRDGSVSSRAIPEYSNIVDRDTILKCLELNNPGIYTDIQNVNDVKVVPQSYIKAYEADEDEPDTGDDDDAGDDPDMDAGEGDTGEDDAGDDSTDDSGTGDDSADPEEGSSDDPSDSSDTDDEDNTEEPHQEILKLDLELPKEETFDDLMYKIIVAKRIDVVLRDANNGLPVEITTALIKWKSMFLFLVSAKETEQFLKKSKVKLV